MGTALGSINEILLQVNGVGVGAAVAAVAAEEQEEFEWVRCDLKGDNQ